VPVPAVKVVILLAPEVMVEIKDMLGKIFDRLEAKQDK